jgi:hypothetical protein
MSARSWGVLLGVLIVGAALSGVALIRLESPNRVERLARTRLWSVVGLAVMLAAIVTVVGTQGGLDGLPPPVAGPKPTLPAKAVPLSTVLRLVAASNTIRTVPPNLVPPLAEATTDNSSDLGFPPVRSGCRPTSSQTKVPTCAFGDLTGAFTMVLYGDSHAGMWFQALEDIAKHAQWRLIVLYKPACLAIPLPIRAVGTPGDWVACAQWQRLAIKRINEIHPDLLIVSQASFYESPTGIRYSPSQWQQGSEALFQRVKSPGTTRLVLANLPLSRGPDCLAQHPDDVQSCATPPRSTSTLYNAAERRAAADKGARYVDVTPWFCDKTCSAVIGNYDVYASGGHVTVGYSRFLEGALAESLDLSSFR